MPKPLKIRNRGHASIKPIFPFYSPSLESEQHRKITSVFRIFALNFEIKNIDK